MGCKVDHLRTWQTAHVVRPCAFAAAAALVAGLAAAGSGAADPPPASCTLPVGQTVMLRSSDFDPDVLVWDSREWAMSYANGTVRNAADVLGHTLLSKPGTHAIVIQCLPRTAHPTGDTTVGSPPTTSAAPPPPPRPHRRICPSHLHSRLNAGYDRRWMIDPPSNDYP